MIFNWYPKPGFCNAGWPWYLSFIGSSGKVPIQPAGLQTIRLAQKQPKGFQKEPRSHMVWRCLDHPRIYYIFWYSYIIHIYIHTYVYVFICWHLNSEICFCKQKGLDLDICCAQWWVWLVGQFLVLPALYIEQRIGTLRKLHMVIVIDSFPIKTAICHV